MLLQRIGNLFTGNRIRHRGFLELFWKKAAYYERERNEIIFKAIEKYCDRKMQIAILKEYIDWSKINIKELEKEFEKCKDEKV